MKWLLRLIAIRVLGRWAVPALAALGLVGALRNARTRDTVQDRASGRFRRTGDPRWR